MNLNTKKRIDYYLGGVLILLLKPFVYLVGICLRRDHSLKENNKIVLFKILGGGSVVLAYPAILKLRMTYPNSEFVFVGSNATVPFAKSLCIFDKNIILNDNSLIQLIISFVKNYHNIIFCDSFIDLEVYSRLSSVISVLTFSRNRISFFMESVFWKKNLQTHLIYLNKSANICDFYNKIPELYGVSQICYKDAQKEFQNKWVGIQNKDELQSRVVGVAPCCSENGRERMLSISQWVSILSQNELTSKIKIYGGKTDYIFCQKLKESLVEVRIDVDNLAGKTSIDQVIKDMMNLSKLYSVDSSLLHLARLLNIKVESYWGPTAPHTRLLSYPLIGEVTHYAQTLCSPCIHVTEAPPCKGNNKCIKNIFENSDNKFTPIM